ncbi:E3 ubiquitin-protein ligase TRIM17-like isoform X2 [Ambystoma mexicanum]|uniref:E3 ubiquitin-protein ligase TRIM17-like isoform X2 n=1 Tax=Ambystoma mexicanum TaxID=8296 RepID=UPI0037E899C7
MAAAQPLQSLQKEVTCSICIQYFQDPVSIDCGHSFCRACISRCWEELDADPRCPYCRVPSQEVNLRPNKELRNIVEIVKLNVAPPSPPGGDLCPRHQQRLQLFCEEDHIPLCVICRDSPEHTSHAMHPIEEAAEKYKEMLLSHVEQLTRQLEGLQKWATEESTTASELEENFQEQKDKILSAFWHLIQFLEQERQQVLTRLEEEQEENMKKIQAKLTNLDGQQSTHRSLIMELKMKCQQQDVQLLKDVKNLLDRCGTVTVLKPEEDALGEGTAQQSTRQQSYLQEKLLELKDYNFLLKVCVNSRTAVFFKMDNGMYWSSTSDGVKGQTERNNTCRFYMCFKNPGIVEIMDYNNKYLSLTTNRDCIKAVQRSHSPLTEFQINYSNNKIIFKASNGLYLSRIYYVGIEMHYVEAQKESLDVFCHFEKVL